MPNWLSRTIAGLARRSAPSWWSDKLSWGALVPPIATRSRVPVTPESALALTAAYACVDVISTTIASLPCGLYRWRKDGGRDFVRDHPLCELLTASPDGECSAINWEQAWISHALLWGNGYNQIDYDDDGVVSRIRLLDPKETAAERRPQDRKLYYRSGTATLPPYRVLHLAGLGYDGLSGYSPIRLAREAIGLGLAAEAFGGSFFGNSARPSGVLQTAQKLNPQALLNLRESWERVHQAADNAGKVAILEQGLTWQATMIPPEDAQFLETRRFQVLEVCRLYRVPPHKIGYDTSAPRANVEESNRDFVQSTLSPWCSVIESSLNFRLLTADERRLGLHVRHDFSELLRGSVADRTTYYRTLRELGAISPNEIRVREGMNPIPDDEGGNLYLVQGQYVPLSRLAGTEPDGDEAGAGMPPAVTREPDGDEPMEGDDAA